MITKNALRVKNGWEEYKDYNTIRQWALKGFLPKADALGVELWVNSFCQDKRIYYSPVEVVAATKEQLDEFFKTERERKRARDKRYRYREKAKKAETYVEYQYAATDGYIVIDTETTGLNGYYDELLQVSIIDNNGKVLFDSYFKPLVARSWSDAERVNHISPEMVKNAPCIYDKIGEINEILSHYNKIVGYNFEYFDIDFLKYGGAVFRKDTEYADVMLMFAEVYGEWSEYDQDYKWQKLSTAADYYKYDWSSHAENAHNSLADCYATLFVYEKLTRANENDKI